MSDDSTFCLRKAAKLAKKNNEINLLKNLCVFARDLFDFGLSGLGVKKKHPRLIKPDGWFNQQS